MMERFDQPIRTVSEYLFVKSDDTILTEMVSIFMVE